MSVFTRRVATRFRSNAKNFALRIERMLPQPKITRDGFPRRSIERIVVFGRLPNPTIDYYFRARLMAQGMPQGHFVDIRDEAIAAVPPNGTLVIVCRYASRRLVTWIQRHADVLAGVALFVDDDIGAVITGSEAKIGYRLFLYHRALAPLRRLNRHLDVIWTSTPALARVIADPRAVVLPPAPPEIMWRRDDADAQERRGANELVIAYHATAVHGREHRFLRPVIEQVLEARPGVRFDVTADDRAAKAWHGLDRVEITPPGSWEAYLERTRRQRADIMLVPLLRSRANETRADTKRIDVVRLGAAGVFSISSAYGEADDSGELRLPNRRRLWVQVILSLIDDECLRQQVAAATLRLVEASTRRAEAGLPGLDTYLP